MSQERGFKQDGLDWLISIIRDFKNCSITGRGRYRTNISNRRLLNTSSFDHFNDPETEVDRRQSLDSYYDETETYSIRGRSSCRARSGIHRTSSSRRTHSISSDTPPSTPDESNSTEDDFDVPSQFNHSIHSDFSFEDATFVTQIQARFQQQRKPVINKCNLPLISRLEMIEHVMQENMKNSGKFDPKEPEDYYIEYSGKFPPEYSYLRHIHGKGISMTTLSGKSIIEKLKQTTGVPESNALLLRQKALVALNWRQSEIESESLVFKESTLTYEGHRLGVDPSKAIIWFKIEAYVYNFESKEFIPIDPTKSGEFEQGTRFKIYKGSKGFEVQVIAVQKDCLKVKYAVKFNNPCEVKEEIEAKQKLINCQVSVHKIHTDFQYSYAISGINRMLDNSNFDYFIRPDKYAKELDPLIDVETQSFNKLIRAICHYYEVNEIEAQAIYSICTSTSKQFPFIFHGPCASSINDTTCKAIELLMEIDPNFRVLLCTPTNKHAKAVVESLKARFSKSTLNEDNVWHLVAFAGSVAGRDSALDPLCCIDHELEDFNPLDASKLEESRVIVCTATASAHLCKLGVWPGYFSHIFCTESTLMSLDNLFIPIGLYATPKTSVVLTGDPFQLPPVCTLDLGKRYTAFISTLRHYLRLDVYNENPNLSCLLNYSDRIQEDFLNLIGEVFYETEKVFTGIKSDSVNFSNSVFKRENKLPFAFINVIGQEEREEDTNSCTNKEETEAICWLINQLVNINGVKPEEIGVVIGYRAHLKDVRLELKEWVLDEKQLSQIMIDSVERFQGTKRSFMIFATTRTTRDIGFMKEMARIYTAVTRANKFLFVVGHSRALLLSASNTWRKLIGYFKEKDVFYEFENKDLIHVELS